MNILQEIKDEIIGLIEGLEAQGIGREDIQQFVVNSFDHTVVTAFKEIALEVASSPDAGLAFTYSVYQSLGGINGALVEKGYGTLHLRDSDFMRTVLIKTIEEFTGDDIDHIMTILEEHQKGVN